MADDVRHEYSVFPVLWDVIGMPLGDVQVLRRLADDYAGLSHGMLTDCVLAIDGRLETNCNRG